MKKLVLNLVALFTLMTFSACGIAIDERFRDEPVLTALKSLSINLGGLQYLDNRVEVTGVQNPEDGVFEVTGIKVLPIFSDEKVVLAKFVAHQNTDLGFQLDYSDDWSVEEFVDRVYFRAPSDPSITEGVLIQQEAFAYQPTNGGDGSTDTPLVAYEAKLRLTKEFVNADFTLSKIGPDKLNALKFENEELSDITYFIYRAGFIYSINFVPSSSSAKITENL